MEFESSEKIRRIGSAILTVVFGGGAPRMRFLRRAAQAANTTIKSQDTTDKDEPARFLSKSYPGRLKHLASAKAATK